MASPLSPVKTAVEKISEEEEAQLDLELGGGEEEEEEDQDQDVRKAEEADTGTPKLAPLTRDELRQGLDRMAQQQQEREEEREEEGREQDQVGDNASTTSTSSVNSKFANKAPHEDCTMDSWRRRKKHMFVFSNAGKPVFSRYGDEHLMSTFFAAAQAILSFVGDKWGDRLLLMEGSVHRRRKSIWKGREKSGGGGDENNRSGVVACVGVLNPRAVFLEKGPLTFVCVSRTNEPTDLLRVQLELLHSQFISILTLGIERAFSRSANFDMRKLLNGTGPLLRSVIHSGTWELPVIFGGIAPLPLDLELRKSIGQSLQGCFVPDLLCSILFTEDRIICISKRKRFKMDHKDLFLFTNFVRLNDSFKQNESFIPFCFPSFNASAFLYVYVSYITDKVCLALVSGRSDSFHELAEAKLFVQNFFEQEKIKATLHNALDESSLKIPEMPMSAGGGFVGETPLWHYVYYHKKLKQLLSPGFASPLHRKEDQKKVLRHYQEMVWSLHKNQHKGQNTVRWRRNSSFVVIACISLDFDLYAVFDSVIDSDRAVRICNQLCTWIHSKEANLLMPVFQLKSNSRITAAAKRASLSPNRTSIYKMNII